MVLPPRFGVALPLHFQCHIVHVHIAVGSTGTCVPGSSDLKVVWYMVAHESGYHTMVLCLIPLPCLRSLSFCLGTSILRSWSTTPCNFNLSFMVTQSYFAFHEDSCKGWPSIGGMPCTQCTRSAHAVRSFECRQILRPYFWPLLTSFWFHQGFFELPMHLGCGTFELSPFVAQFQPFLPIFHPPY